MISTRLQKTITWRIIASGTTFIVSYIITGEVKGSLGITVANSFVKTIFYYVHEWLWDRKTLDEKEKIENIT